MMKITNQKYISKVSPSNTQSQSMGNIGMNSTSNQNNNDEIKEVIPRPDDFSPSDEDNKIFAKGVPVRNIIVEANNGLRLMIKAEETTTIRDFLRMYMKKLGLNESHIDKDIVFLFAGFKLNSQSMETIEKFKDFSIITAFDQNNVIGA